MFVRPTDLAALCLGLLGRNRLLCWGLLLVMLPPPLTALTPGGPLALRTSQYIYPPHVFARPSFFFSFDRVLEWDYATRSTRGGDPNRDKVGVKEGGEGIGLTQVCYMHSMSHTRHMEVVLWEIQSSIYI